MKREEILDLVQRTADNDDAGFQKVISALLDEQLVSMESIANYFGCSLTTVRRWSVGENAPAPVMRKHIFEYLQELLKCTCPKKCDCQNPLPDNWDGKSGVYHISEMCPKHNMLPWPHPDCMVHK